ncbi:DUF5908 family protein [Flavobacterium sp.]|uniref:DUF5908 family protein n=1 Tax=Flavobacterium sp. TaxID=239 RepID=UPI003D1339D4
MAIEIKELRIKVTVNEEANHQMSDLNSNSPKLKELKASLIQECTKKVLEHIKERAER